jgi:hypothetical protein
MTLSTGTVVFEDATLKAVELVAETMTLNNFSVSSTTSLQQATNVSNVTTNTVEFTNPTTAFVTTGNVGVGTDNPNSTLHIVSNQNSSFSLDASSIADTSYSEMRMTGPGQTNPGILSMFCNGANRTADGGASTTTIRNNNGKIRIGGSYETELYNPVDLTFVAGMWTQTIGSTTVTTTIKKNIGSCMTTKTPDGFGGASGFSGSAGVFVAPFDGLYQFQCVCFAQSSSSNLLIVFNANGPSVTNNTWNTRNVIGDYHEVIDLRSMTNEQEPHGFSVLLDMKENDAVDLQNHSTGYLGADLLRCSCFLVHRL